MFNHSQMPQPVFDVFDYGAKGDGITIDQEAIQKAIDKCNGTGGTVYLHNGKFLTGQISLGNDMTLFIDSTATVLGIQSDKQDHYPSHLIETRYPNRMLEDCQRRLIYGNHVHNLTITGKGTIDGQGDFYPWMNVKELGAEKDRPGIFAFVASTNITVSGLTLIDPACWTQVYIECDSLIISELTINSGRLTPNRDGIDIVDCHEVLIEKCDIRSEDDGICFKSGSEFGCKNVVVRDCEREKRKGAYLCQYVIYVDMDRISYCRDSTFYCTVRKYGNNNTIYPFTGWIPDISIRIHYQIQTVDLWRNLLLDSCTRGSFCWTGT